MLGMESSSKRRLTADELPHRIENFPLAQKLESRQNISNILTVLGIAIAVIGGLILIGGPSSIRVGWNGPTLWEMILLEFVRGNTGHRRTHYEVVIQPPVWRLGLMHNSRIFQTQTTDAIVRALLEERGIIGTLFSRGLIRKFRRPPIRSGAAQPVLLQTLRMMFMCWLSRKPKQLPERWRRSLLQNPGFERQCMRWKLWKGHWITHRTPLQLLPR